MLHFLLPSRLLLSVPEFHQISPFCKGVADCNRRWGIAPRPEENVSTF